MNPIAIIKERPFDGRLRVIEVGERALSIAEIIASQDNLPAAFVENCEARINGDLVPRPLWRHVRLRPYPGREVVVTFTLPLHGGGGGSGGGKNVWSSVASVAILLAAAAAGSWAAQTAWFAMGGLGLAPAGAAAVASAALAIGGTLAVAALTPPPTLSSDQGGRGGDATHGAASLSGNLLARGAPLPRVIGEHRLYPPLLTPPLIEIVGEQLVAEAIYGLAGPHRIRDPFAGTTAVSTLEDIQIEIQEGLPNSPQVGLVTRQSFTDTSIAAQMSQHQVDPDNDPELKDQASPENALPQWEGLSSRVALDELWIALHFVAGLTDTSARTMFVPLRIRMRQRGGSDWINLPEFHVIKGQAKPFQVAVKLMWQPAPQFAPAIAKGSGGPVRAYTNVPSQTVAPSGVGGWTADSYFYAGSGDATLHSGNWESSGVINVGCFTDRIEFYLDDAVKFPKSGIWELQIVRGQAVRSGSFNRTSYTTTIIGDGSDNAVRSLFDYRTSAGKHQALWNQQNITDVVAIARVASIWNEHPIPDPTRFAVIAVKVTDRSIDRFSVLAGGYVNDWDGSAWADLKVTSNPAPHLRDVLTGSLGGSPLPAELTDDQSLLDWRAHCIDKGYAVNAVLEGKTYLDAANVICGAGYARLLHSETWGVTIDRDRSAEPPVQIFTPRNMRDFSWTRAFSRPPTGIRAAFRNKEREYEPDEIILYDDPGNPDANGLEQISYDGLTDAAAVAARARFDLEQGKRRLTFYRGTVGMESIVCRRGDLVGLQHDVLATQAGFARVKEVVIENDEVTGLKLDGTIPLLREEGIFAQPHLFEVKHLLALGSRTGLLIRLSEGQGTLVKELAVSPADESAELTFVAPFAAPDGLEPDCLVASGRLGQEYSRLIVFGIDPSPDLTAQITFVDEAPELFQ